MTLDWSGFNNPTNDITITIDVDVEGVAETATAVFDTTGTVEGTTGTETFDLTPVDILTALAFSADTFEAPDDSSQVSTTVTLTLNVGVPTEGIDGATGTAAFTVTVNNEGAVATSSGASTITIESDEEVNTTDGA